MTTKSLVTMGNRTHNSYASADAIIEDFDTGSKIRVYHEGPFQGSVSTAPFKDGVTVISGPYTRTNPSNRMECEWNILATIQDGIIVFIHPT